MVRLMSGGPGKFGALLALPLAALASTPASAATANASVNANIVKPVVFTATGSLNFGTIVTNNLTANRIVSLSPTNVLTCGGSSELICSGATSVPTYNVQGTNKQVITIIKTPSTLRNSLNGATLTLTPIGPSSITLTNSGAPGESFAIGGSFTITPTTGEGVYSGVVDVTVDYQ